MVHHEGLDEAGGLRVVEFEGSRFKVQEFKSSRVQEFKSSDCARR
jgi:hypothetical protein